MFYKIKTYGSLLVSWLFCTHIYYTSCFYEIKTCQTSISHYFLAKKFSCAVITDLAMDYPILLRL